MADFKNNHYVPEMLLKRFTDGKGGPFYYDKRKPDKPVERRNLRTIFCEPNLYVDIDKANNRDVSLERDIYGKLENDAEPIVEKIIDSARKGKLPGLSSNEKFTWDEFIITQTRRTPEARDSLIGDFDFEKSYFSLIADLESSIGPIKPVLKLELMMPETIRRIERSSKIKSLKDSLPNVVQIIANKGLTIARPVSKEKSFIIGSYPVARRFAKNKPDLREPTTEFWLPISSDVIVSPFGTQGQESLIFLDGNQMRKINSQINNQSFEIAGRSKELLQSLLSGR